MVVPNDLTYISILQACNFLAGEGLTLYAEGESATLHIGRAIHRASQTVAPSLFVSSALVSMYSKCGAISEAEHVFSAMSSRNIMTWNSLLAGYLQEGLYAKVLLLYRQMHLAGFVPNEHTLLFAVQACGGLTRKEESLVGEKHSIKVFAMAIVEALQMDAQRNNLSRNTFVGTSLIRVYGKCGAVIEAESIFTALPYHDKVAWNAMLSVYTEQNCGVKALRLYRQMHEQGLIADKVGLILALQACSILFDNENISVEEVRITQFSSLEIGKCMHADMRKKGHTLDVCLGSALLSMYAKLGAVSSAENVFIQLPSHDVVSWSTMVSLYVEQGQGATALQLCHRMLEEGISLDPHALVFALQACCILAEKDDIVAPKISAKSVAFEIGRTLHAEACSNGFISDPHLGLALVSMYGKFGAFDEANCVYYASFRGNTVLWNVMLAAYLEHGHHCKVLSLYVQMQEQQLVLDDVTFIWVLQACRLLGSLQVCKQIHFVCASSGWDHVLSVATSIIHAYGNCGTICDARATSDALASPDLVLWNVCCTGYTGMEEFLGCRM